MRGRCPARYLVLPLLAFLASPAAPQAGVTSPEAQFGFAIGADYHLANYSQLAAYWRKLESESERIRLQVIGETEGGREMLMAVVTSPANHARIEHLREIARRLALAEGLDEEQARALAAEGRAVVWIDGGLHATEVLVAQQLIETVYRLVSGEDAETRRLLDDVIVLCCNPNPDGQELVADWYMREEDPEKRSYRDIPHLYQKYIGHDNNRDYFMNTQKETVAVSRVLYREWFPQIVFNHHQSGPAGTVLFAPPFRDPFNYVFDPLVPVGIELVSAAMHTRFLVEGKRGATMRGGASFSTWWNGGLRSTAYYHNMIGLLTETIGSPKPMAIPLRLSRQLASSDLPAPIAPQKWHFRQSVEYSVSSNLAVLDVASRHREQMLFNVYRMAHNSIEHGSRDHWTMWPDRIAAAEKIAAEQRTARGEGGEERPRVDIWETVLHDPVLRDPRGYVIPADQPDFPTATKFVNALIQSGVAVHRAREDFGVAGKRYPAGSFVVLCAQAFRPHVLSMFEPQIYPDDFAYPGGPPKAPYDSAGWTLAFQMGIRFDRILEGFDGPFERIEGLASPPPGRVPAGETVTGWLLDQRLNDAFVAVNRLLKSGEKVYRLVDARHPAGSYYVPRTPGSLAVLRATAALGVSALAVDQRPEVAMLPLRPVRIGLWDRYGGSMSSGWTRWLLERFEFDFELVFPARLDAGELRRDYDVLVFPGGAIPGQRSGSSQRSRRRREPNLERVPEAYRDRLGRVSAEKTVPQLRAFLEAGGSIATIGSSTALAYHLELPLNDALVRRQPDGSEVALPRDEFFVPGSVMRARVDTAHPIAVGMGEHTDVYFRRSPVFRLRPDASERGLRPVVWFDSVKPLRSGWAWGQHHLSDGVAVVEARLGAGVLYLFGPEVIFRAQPHGTFKLFFNALHHGPARAAASGIAPVPRAGDGE